MGLLIDSSVLIAAERGALDLEAALGSRRDEDCAIAAITASELLHGVHRAKGAARRARREAWVEAVLARLPVVAFDLVAARIHGRLSAGLSGAGTAVGAHDLLIAASALARGLDLITRDERSFARIPGLSWEVW